MESHVRVLGILNVVYGAVGAVAGILILVVFGGAVGLLGMFEGDPDALAAVPIVGVIGIALSVLVLLLSLPCVIAGVGLLQWRPWARSLTIVVSSINLLNVPFGTILGAYGFWVLLAQEAEPLFENPPVRYARS
jgi:hypothetical protein